MKVTAEDVIKRSAELGFHITKPGFAQHIADMCNEPIRFPDVPPPPVNYLVTPKSFHYPGLPILWGSL